MAVTANQQISKKAGCRGSYPVAASTRIYEGTLTYVNANGYLDDDTGSGVNKFAGIAVREVDNSSGSNGDLNCEVYTEGEYLLTGSGFMQADVGKNAFATDNWAMVVADAATAVKIGVVTEYVSTTQLRVKIDATNAFQAAALTAALTTITITDAAGTPDYALSALTTTTPYGLATLAEAVSLLYVIKNLQTRVGEIEAILQSNGLAD